MSGRWREEQTTKFVNMYKDSEHLRNVFTPEYKNREPRLASLEHMVREMNIYTEQGQLNWSTFYPIAGTV
jgi:acyl carrier protein phosphodiesterase